MVTDGGKANNGTGSPGAAATAPGGGGATAGGTGKKKAAGRGPSGGTTTGSTSTRSTTGGGIGTSIGSGTTAGGGKKNAWFPGGGSSGGRRRVSGGAAGGGGGAAAASPPPGMMTPATATGTRNTAANTTSDTASTNTTSSTSAATSQATTAATLALNRDRFLSLLLTLIGHNVTLTQNDGTVLEGIFHAFTPFESQSGSGKSGSTGSGTGTGSGLERRNVWVLKGCRRIKKAGDAARGDGTAASPAASFPNGSTVVMPSSKVRSVAVKSVRLDTAVAAVAGSSSGSIASAGKAGAAFRTDTDISSSGAGGGGRDGDGDDLIMAGSAWISPPPPASRKGDANGGGGSLEGRGGGGSGGRSGGSKHGGAPPGTAAGGAGTGAAAGTSATAATTGGLGTGPDSTIGTWDQFSANEQLFNVRASYDETIYTTALDKSSMTKSKQREAERIAKEIERQTTTNLHLAEERGHKIEGDYDEEDRYSGVLTSGGKVRAALESSRRASGGAGSSEGGGVGGTTISKKLQQQKAATAAPAAAPTKRMNYAAAAAKVASGAAQPTQQQKQQQPPAVPTGDKEANKETMALAEVAQEGAGGGDGGTVAQKKEEEVAPAAEAAPKGGDGGTEGGGGGGETSADKGGKASSTTATAESTATVEKKAESKLSASAKEFTFNPGAKTFTPGGGGGGGGSMMPPPNANTTDGGAGGMAHMGGVAAAGVPMSGQAVYMQHPPHGMVQGNAPYGMNMQYQAPPYGGAMQHPGQLPPHMAMPQVVPPNVPQQPQNPPPEKDQQGRRTPYQDDGTDDNGTRQQQQQQQQQQQHPVGDSIQGGSVSVPVPVRVAIAGAGGAGPARTVTADTDTEAAVGMEMDNGNINSGRSRKSSADDPDTDDGYAVGIDLEGADGDYDGTYDFGGSGSGSDGGRGTGGKMAPPPPPVVDSVSVGTAATADNSTTAEAGDAMMDDGSDVGTAGSTSPGRPLGASQRVQTTVSTRQNDDEHPVDDSDQTGDRNAPAGLSDSQTVSSGGCNADPPETKSSDGSTSGDQASIASPDGRKALRRELESVDKDRKRQRPRLPSPPKTPEPPEPIFPLQQLQENLLQSPRREAVLRSVSETLVKGSLTAINLSQRGLTATDANVIKLALMQNPHLSVLKLSYNSLGDEGATIIAAGIGRATAPSETAVGTPSEISEYRHHASLSVLDLGFNGIGDVGCASLSNIAIAGNAKLSTLYMSGNYIRGPGAMSLAAAIAKGGCGLIRLHLTANRIGILGTRGIAVAIAETEARRQQVAAAVSAATTAAVGRDTATTTFPQVNSMQELHLGGVNMGSTGCLAVSNMALSNQALRVLSLCDNGITDRDLALFSQSISRNKALPLEKLLLSFNRLTCVGVESLMNAIWGSKTLKELRLDNNHIKDRGAQLAAVTLTSINLKVLDMGFNQILTVGIKAIMKSLSENTSLESLVLSGNPLDINASKAVSYALAYNRTLKKLNVDNCSVGYAAQRHIAAGIVSNSGLALKAITGFRLGSIAVTLGLPPALDKWSNEQTLKFIRFMWGRKRHDERQLVCGGENGSTTDGSSSTASKPGPADPTLVVSAAKKAFEEMGDSGGAFLLPETPPRQRLDSCPLVVNEAVMLESSSSGNIRVPILLDDARERRLTDEVTPLRKMMDQTAARPLTVRKDTSTVDPAQREHLEQWLGQHLTSLTELANLPFKDADLWKLHQYFFSPVGTSIFKKSSDGPQIVGNSDGIDTRIAVKGNQTPKKAGGLTRKTSFRHLGDAAAADPSMTQPPSICKRRSLDMIDSGSGSTGDGYPATKRARSNKPRIDYYPRVRTLIETLRYQTDQNKVLVKLRQLKYVEGSMFQGRNVQTDPDPNSDGFTTFDVEAVLDMLG